MNHHYENFEIYVGEKYSVYFHAQTSTYSEVYEYYKGCDDVTRASLLYLIKRMADFGHIYDETKFRIEDKENKIYCFKPKSERFFCFFIARKRIIITSGYTKKKQKLDRHHLAKAIRICKEYV